MHDKTAADLPSEMTITSNAFRAGLTAWFSGLFLLILFGTIGVMICATSPLSDHASWAEGVLCCMLGVALFVITVGFRKTGTWTLTDDRLRYTPRKGAPVQLAWTDITQVEWLRGIVMGPHGEKIPLPQAGNDITPGEAVRAHEFLIRKLGEPFGYERWRGKSHFVWSDPTTWFRWLGEMIVLLIVGATPITIVLFLIRYDRIHVGFLFPALLCPVLIALWRMFRLSSVSIHRQ